MRQKLPISQKNEWGAIVPSTGAQIVSLGCLPFIKNSTFGSYYINNEPLVA